MDLFSGFLQGKAVATAAGTHIQNPSGCHFQSCTLQQGHLLFCAEQFFDGNFVLIEL